MHEQRLAEHPLLEEVQVLLAPQRVGDRQERLLELLGQRAELRLGELRLGEVLQAMSARLGDELVEVQRVVDLGERVVEEQAVDVLCELARLGSEHLGELAVGLTRCAEQRQEAARRRHPLLGPHDRLDVVAEHLAQRLARMAAGHRVVADVGDAVLRERRGAEREQAGADVLGHPGEDAVRDDVIDAAGRRLVVRQRDLLEGDVRQPEACGRRLRTRDRAARRVDADERRARQRDRHRQQVAARAAAELEHAARRGCGCRDAEEPRQRREPVGMGLDEGAGRIEDRVVWGRVRHRRDVQNVWLLARSKPATVEPPAVPVGDCALCSICSLEYDSENRSLGITAVALSTPERYALTRTSDSVSRMNSNWPLPPPALPVRTAERRCSPVAQACSSRGLALLNGATTSSASNVARPVPPPPPAAGGASWLTPKENDSTSISPLCLASALPPTIPSIFRKYGICGDRIAHPGGTRNGNGHWSATDG